MEDLKKTFPLNSLNPMENFTFNSFSDIEYKTIYNFDMRITYISVWTFWNSNQTSEMVELVLCLIPLIFIWKSSKF